MRVSVFGSASAREGDAAYLQALDLGRLLAEAGWTVCTGGYDGTMAGASRGAREAGGHVIGVTMATWSRFDLRPNRWVAEHIEAENLLTRLGHLLEADAFVALPGGIGTVSEVLLAWQLLQAWEVLPQPLVLMGEAWTPFLNQLAGSILMRPGDLDLVRVVLDAAEAVAVVRDFDRAAELERRERVRIELMRTHAKRG